MDSQAPPGHWQPPGGPTSPLHERVACLVRELPKVDLHVHLSGAIRPSTAAELAGLRASELCLALPSRLMSYSDFFAPWNDVLSRVPETPNTAARLILELAEDLSAEGVQYAELRMSARKSLIDNSFPDWLEAIDHASSLGRSVYGVDVRFVLGFARHRLESATQANRLGNNLLEGLDLLRYTSVVGLDIWGNEDINRGLEFEVWLQGAAVCGLPISLHAGETPASHRLLRERVMALRPRRLSHGPVLQNSPAVVRMLRQRSIGVEACLTSNIVTQSGLPTTARVGSLRRLLDASVPVAFCSDDPTVLSTSLTREITVALCSSVITPQELRKTMRNSIVYSFAESSLKGELLSKIDSDRSGAILAEIEGCLDKVVRKGDL